MTMSSEKAAALQAVFLWDGALHNDVVFAKATEAGGVIDFADTIAHYAPLLATFLVPYEKADTDWPGVYEYEVTDGLGRWLADRCANNLPPSDTEFLEQAAYDTKRFFDQ